ncbi:MAG: hypothetical protein KAG84_04980 [Bacteroidales bacterium]|nr:hypothetical protein [Bacteroidales bacterium]
MRELFILIIILTLNYQKGNAQNIRQMNTNTDTKSCYIPIAKNIVYGNVNYAVLFSGASINYERTIYSNKNSVIKHLMLKASGGAFTYYSFKHLSLSTVALLSKSDYYLEVGFGIGYFIYLNPSLEGGLLPLANIGYRYQISEGGFLYRIGISFPEGLYVGAGYNF